MQGNQYQRSRFLTQVVFAALIALPLTGAATVYKCKGANGNAVFAEVPCGDDAQVQAVQAQPKINSTPAAANGNGGHPNQRDEAAACWLPKYEAWRTQYPQLAANASQNLERMQQFQKECNWTPRSATITPTTNTPWPAAPKPAAGATSGFDSYLADAQQLERMQSVVPKAIIRYSDPVNGALLKSIQDPSRVSPLLNAAIRQSDMQQFDQIKRILLSLLKRYSQAFKGNSVLYETEYLDSLEINTTVVGRIFKQAISESLKSTGNDSKYSQDLAQLNQSVSGLMSQMSQASAKDLRQQIASGKFSPAAMQRATGLAKAMESQ